MDLREVRKEFVEKSMKYACSYDPGLYFDPGLICGVPGGARVTLMRRTVDEREEEGVGRMFHVLDAISVAGVDERKHDTPAGRIQCVEETIVFNDDDLTGNIEGRIGFVIDDGATIDATYTGRLRLKQPLGLSLGWGRILEGTTWIAPLFATSDTRYRWLSDRACAAFGTWVAAPSGRDASLRNVTGRLDVYSLG